MSLLTSAVPQTVRVIQALHPPIDLRFGIGLGIELVVRRFARFVQRRIGVVVAWLMLCGARLNAERVAIEIQLFLELPLHDARHTPSLSKPGTKLVRNARQSLGPKYDEPDHK